MMVSAALRVGRSVVITNAGTGLGRDVALLLASLGYIIFGTANSADEVGDLRAASGGRVSLTVCDTTKATLVEAWAGGVMEALGAAGLNILINNARILTQGPIEILPLDVIRHDIECNVIGTIAATNAFLPALRTAHGRIVQISSWTAHLPLPFSGLSAATSAAMEVISAVYRAELKTCGIEVVVASLDDVTTASPERTMAAARIAATMTPEQRKLYGKAFVTAEEGLGMLADGDLELPAAAARVVEIAEQRPPSSRTAVGPTAERMLRAAREKPDTELDALSLSLVGLG